jgi:hypothetical protein
VIRTAVTLVIVAAWSALATLVIWQTVTSFRAIFPQ